MESNFEMDMNPITNDKGSVAGETILKEMCNYTIEFKQCNHQYINAGTLQGEAMKRCIKCSNYIKAK